MFALALLSVVTTLCAIACSDSDGGSSGPCGPTEPAIDCDGPPTIAVIVPAVVPGDGAPFEGVAQDELALGDPAAPVTIDLYQNFLCGHCADFAREIMPPLVTEYAAAGRVRFLFHHVPLGGGAAISAHEASQCAADQGRFWQAYAQLYANFSQETAAYTDDRLETMMANAGVDPAVFAECLDNEEHREEIEATVAAFGEVQTIPGAGFAAATAVAQGRQLLPVVIVNAAGQADRRVIVAPTLEELRALLEGLIEEKLP
jgi:thioredoxin family protein